MLLLEILLRTMSEILQKVLKMGTLQSKILMKVIRMLLLKILLRIMSEIVYKVM